MPLAASPLVCSLLIAIAAPVEAPKPDPGVLLRYRFSAGESIAYRLEHDATFWASKGQLREKNASRTSTDQRFEVVSVADDGTATLRIVIDHTRMEYAFNDEKPSVFDSSEKALPAPVFAGVSRAIGQPLAEVRIRQDGVVESVRPLLSEEGGQLSEEKTGAQGDGPTSLFAIFPDRPIHVGEEWNDSFQTKVSVTKKLSRDVTILRQYRLESVENGIATIAVKISPVTTITEPSQLVQLIQRTASGTLRFDLRAGRVVGRSIRADNIEVGWAGADSSYRALCIWDERLAEKTAISAR